MRPRLAAACLGDCDARASKSGPLTRLQPQQDSPQDSPRPVAPSHPRTRTTSAPIAAARQAPQQEVAACTRTPSQQQRRFESLWASRSEDGLQLQLVRALTGRARESGRVVCCRPGACAQTGEMQCGPPGPGAATQPIVPAHHLVDAWTFGMHAVGGAGWTGHQPGVPPASPPSATASVTGLHGEQQPTSSHDDNSDGCDACEGCPEPWLLAWAASAGAQPAPPAGSGAGAGTLVSAAQQAPQPMSLPGAAYFMQHQHQQQLLQTSLSGIPPSPAPGQPPSSSAGAAPSAKAAAASPGLALAEPPKLSRRQRMNERKLKELAAAKGEVESLTARQAELVAKLEELRADHRSLLDAVADITAKYQAAVTDNARLNRLLTAEQQQRQQQHATHQAAALPLPVLSQAPELGEGKQLWLPF